MSVNSIAIDWDKRQTFTSLRQTNAEVTMCSFHAVWDFNYKWMSDCHISFVFCFICISNYCWWLLTKTRWSFILLLSIEFSKWFLNPDGACTQGVYSARTFQFFLQFFVIFQNKIWTRFHNIPATWKFKDFKML